MSYWDVFASLPRPSAPGFFTVERGERRFRVGRSYENHPAVLIDFQETRSFSLPRRLASLIYSPPAAVEVAAGNGVHETVSLAVLECRTTDAELGAYFLRIATSILMEDPNASTELGFEIALDSLVTLFRSLQRAGTTTIQGLWAELAIVLWSNETSAALSSWHSSPCGLHDFSAGSFRFEVKSSRKRLREHTFALEQLETLGKGATIIASLLLEESDDGASVFDLVSMICNRIARDSAARLEAIVGESLGNGWREAADVRFSIEHARASLHLYAAEDIPTIPQPLPPEIKNVHFTVDLSGVRPLPWAEVAARADFFQRLIPPLPWP